MSIQDNPLSSLESITSEAYELDFQPVPVGVMRNEGFGDQNPSQPHPRPQRLPVSPIYGNVKKLLPRNGDNILRTIAEVIYII
jgi:hypothetical protein